MLAYPHHPQFCLQVDVSTGPAVFEHFSVPAVPQTKFGGHFRQSVDVRKVKIARKGQLEKCLVDRVLIHAPSARREGSDDLWH